MSKDKVLQVKAVKVILTVRLLRRPDDKPFVSSLRARSAGLFFAFISKMFVDVPELRE